MDPKLLVHLAVAIDYGSLNRAAHHLGLTQPTLSRSIKIIEDRVGGPVLLRESFGVVATDVGEILAQRGRAVLAEAENADRALRDWREGRRLELNLGVGPLLAATVIPEFIQKAVQSRWPYKLKLSVASAAPLIERLNDGRLDVVLAPSQLRLHNEYLAQDTILPDRLIILAGRKSRLSKPGVRTTKSDLEDAKWIIAGARAGIHGTETDIFDRLGIKPRSVEFVISGDLLIPLHLLRTTDCLIVLPERLFLLLDDTDGVGMVQFDFDTVRRDIALWMRKSDQHKTDFLHFKQAVIEHFEGIAGQFSEGD